MISPKFKHGETVRALKNDAFFKITGVVFEKTDGGYYVYFGFGSGGFREDEIELFQESEKLNLFAYRVRGTSEIVYSKNPNLEDPASLSSELFIRCTGCDPDKNNPL